MKFAVLKSSVAAVLMGVSAVVCSGCGSAAKPVVEGANVGLSQSAIERAFTAAAGQASALHMQGSMTQGGETMAVDLYLNRDGSGRGQIQQSGYTAPFIIVGGVTYVQLTTSILAQAHYTASKAAQLKGKWLPGNTPGATALTSGIGMMGSYKSLVNDIFSTSSDGMLTSANAHGTAQYQGKSVAVYEDSSGALEYFAADGPAYLLALVDPSTSQPAITFTWNSPTTVSAPPADLILK